MMGAEGDSTTVGAGEASPSAPEVAHSTSANKRGRRRRVPVRFLMIWALPLLLLAAGTLGGAWALFSNAYLNAGNNNTPIPTGGVLLLADAKSPGMDWHSRAVNRTLAASITAETWVTGDPGISELMLKMWFTNAKPGTRWYVVASGQYFPDSKFSSNMFCDNPPQVRLASRIPCRDTLGNGSRNIEYRYRDQIGAPHDGEIDGPLDSVDGYDSRSVAVITGVIGPDLAVATRVFVPYHTPPRQQPSGDEVISLAPIGLYDNEFGSARPLGTVAAGYRDASGRFADLESGQILDYFHISEMDVKVDDEALSKRELESAKPPTASTDKLLWHEEGEGITQISYRLHDPYAQDRIAVYSFGAGLLASVGVAALLLLLEQILARFYERATKRHSRSFARNRAAARDWSKPGGSQHLAG
jgi:hypothetical protein